MGSGRPWWLRIDGVPPGHYERQRRKPTRAQQITVFTLIGVIAAGYLGAAAWNGHVDRRVANRLMRNGATVDGAVVDFRSYTNMYEVFGGEAKVVFTTETAEKVETWVTVGSSVENGPVQIRYLRSDPRVARLRDDLKPRATGLLMLSVIGALFEVPLFLAIRWARRNRDFD